MSRPNIKRPPHPAVRIATHAMWLITSTALIGQLVGAQPAVAASDSAALLAGERPLAEDELADLRGGFFTKDGLEISFGYLIEMDLDDRHALSLQFDPPSGKGDRDRIGRSRSKHGAKPSKGPKAKWHEGKPAKGGSEAGKAKGVPGNLRLTVEDRTARDGPDGLPLAELDLGRRDVTVRSGAPEVTEIEGGTRFVFADGVVADVIESAGGLIVEARVGDDLPVKVVRTARGVDFEVGDDTTGTRIVDHISPNLIASRLVNRRDGAHVNHRIHFDINLLNFSKVAAARKPYQNGRRVQKLVDRGLLRMLTPR